jgi:hypothetical protein
MSVFDEHRSLRKLHPKSQALVGKGIRLAEVTRDGTAARSEKRVRLVDRPVAQAFHQLL